MVQGLRPWGISKPRASPLGTYFSNPISFDSAKKNDGKSRPGFSGSGFASRRPSFRSCEKKAKARRGLGAEELQASRARSRSKRLHPRTPVFTGAQDKIRVLFFPAHKVRTHEAPLFAVAPLCQVLIQVFCQGAPSADGLSRLGALPWAVGSAKGSPPKPSEAGSVGEGGARKRTQFSPLGGNEVERTLRRRASAAAEREARSILTLHAGQ